MSLKVDLLIDDLKNGSVKSLARALTLVENGLAGYQELLKGLEISDVKVIGITGPPGAGKSTLLNALLNLLAENFKVAILAVDPTSPFNHGALLGDRVRMNKYYNHKNVFIRSMATRGVLGGLAAKTIELVDVLRAANFDYIFVETVGVGQSEVEIASLADFTVVVLVPEAGDEIQNIKSGLMEIADIFVVNKADRDGAENFINQLKRNLSYNQIDIPVLATIAEKGNGISELLAKLDEQPLDNGLSKESLLVTKAWQLIQNQLTKHIDKKKLQQDIVEASKSNDFNLYKFIDEFMNS